MRLFRKKSILKNQNLKRGTSTGNHNWWRLWAKALGEKVGDKKEADTIAWFRTFIVLQAIITNLFIVINILFSWFS